MPVKHVNTKKFRQNLLDTVVETKKTEKATLIYNEKQNEIFTDPHRYKIIAKGRRFGLGMANEYIKRALHMMQEKKNLRRQ